VRDFDVTGNYLALGIYLKTPLDEEADHFFLRRISAEFFYNFSPHIDTFYTYAPYAAVLIRKGA